MVRLLAAGDTALTVEFSATSNENASRKVLTLYRQLERQPPHWLQEAVPTTRALTLHYDPDGISFERLCRYVHSWIEEEQEPAARSVQARGRHWLIPVCYDPTVATDIARVSTRTCLSVDAIARIHTCTIYRVAMLGFLPGQPYLSGLPPVLRLPRKKTPSQSVPAGSVAVAVDMTTIYDAASPAGWHVIGRTPARLFDARAQTPVLFAPGDEVGFQAISLETFKQLEQLRESGMWAPVPEVEPQVAA